MKTLALQVAGLILISGLVLWWFMRKAPIGHEDERGFHFTRDHKHRERTPETTTTPPDEAASRPSPAGR